MEKVLEGKLIYGEIPEWINSWRQKFSNWKFNMQDIGKFLVGRNS